MMFQCLQADNILDREIQCKKTDTWLFEWHFLYDLGYNHVICKNNDHKRLFIA